MLTNRDFRIKINKIKTASNLTIEQKRTALNMLKKSYFENKVNANGFSQADNQRASNSLEKLRQQATSKGLPELVAETMNFNELFQYVNYKIGIRTELDESELA